jgi:hypothetical protein
MGGKRTTWNPEQERSPDNKIYWPCTQKQVKENHEGLFCNQVCAKLSGNGKCIENKINVIDPKKEHENLLRGGFLLAPSKLIFK